MTKTGTSQQRKTFGQQAHSKKEHQQIQQDEISKTRQVKITAEPQPSGNKPLTPFGLEGRAKWPS